MKKALLENLNYYFTKDFVNNCWLACPIKKDGDDINNRKFYSVSSQVTPDMNDSDAIQFIVACDSKQSATESVSPNPEEFSIKVEVLADFKKFIQRPDYLVFTPAKATYAMGEDKLMEAYDSRIAGCAILDALSTGGDPIKAISSAKKCVNWLRTTDFYVAPASTRYHDNQPFGLLKHSLDVFDQLLDLKKTEAFSSVCTCSIVLCALVHDWCKIGLYEKYQRNVKDPKTGKWESVDAYNRGIPKYPLGHGEASLYLASQFFNLSFQQALAIRWHMGVWNVSDDDKGDINAAIQQYPEVLMMQVADQLSVNAYIK